MAGLTRAEKSRINKERWRNGERWDAGDSGALTPAGNQPNGNGNGNGNGASGIRASGGAISVAASGLEIQPTPAKRDNRWRSAANGSRGASNVRLVYGVSKAVRGGGRPSGQGARLGLAAQASTPEEARRLAAPLAWPCRCGRCLPERRFGAGWWGYRPVICCKCGRDVL